jgi:hypothetical protein
MRVDHGRLHVTVTEELLNGSDVGSALKQVGGEGMTEGVSADLLSQAGAADRHLNGLVDNTGINMMATDDTRASVNGDIPRGKYVLSDPFPSSPGVLPGQGIGQVHLAAPFGEILLMKCSYPTQMVLEERRQADRKGGEPILIALSRPDGYLLHIEINVLYPESNRFHDPQSASAKKLGDELWGPLHERKQGAHLFPGHDHGHASFFLCTDCVNHTIQEVPKYAFVKKNQGVHALVLGRRGDIPAHGQIRQECLYFGFCGEKRVTRAHAMETNETDNPFNIGPLRVDGVMVKTEDPSDFVKDPRLLVFLWARHRDPPRESQ